MSKKWYSISQSKSPDKKLTIATLHKMAKDDNITKYKNIKNNKSLVSHFPEKNLTLGERKRYNSNHEIAQLLGNICHASETTHPEPLNYIERINNCVGIRCNHKDCIGSIYPSTGYFQINQNITIINNSDNNDLTNRNNTKKLSVTNIEEVDELIYNGFNCRTMPFVKLLHYYYKDRYIHSDNTWYHYINHHWERIGKVNIDLRNQITNKLTKLYKDALKVYTKNDNNNISKNLILKVLDTLDSHSCRDNIMDESKYVFVYDSTKLFERYCDLDNNLICFTNGIYNLSTHEFGPGEPSQLITQCTNYEYTDKKSDNYKDVLQFFKDIQPNDNDREYLLKSLASGLYGNIDELFTIFSGLGGRNGKSKLIELINLTMGDYSGSFSTSLITSLSKKDANPELLDLKTKRMIFSSEPPSDTKLNSSIIKELTGRDSIKARLLFSNNVIEFIPKFVIFMMTNDIPPIDNYDKAIGKRLRCINYPTTFVSKPTKPTERLINKQLSLSFKSWRQDMMILLLEYYRKYKNEGLIPTVNISKWTRMYELDNDIYSEYININLEASKSNISLNKLYKNFTEWYTINYPNEKLISSREFTKNMKKHYDIMTIRQEGSVKPVKGIKNISIISELKDE